MVKCPTSIVFCSGSWGCSYYIGAFKAIQEKWSKDELIMCKFGGISAGSIIALGAALNISSDVLEEIYLELSDSAERYGVFGKMSRYHTKVLDKLITKPDDYKRVKNRLYIGLSNFYGKFVILSEWKSNKDLIDTLHASFHIPYYTTYTRKINNKIAIDGAFTSGWFKIEPTSLVIGCRLRDKEGHIVCKPMLTIKEVFKPNRTKYYDISKKGYTDLMNWDGTYKDIILPKKNHITLSLYWMMRYSEGIF